MAEKNILFFLAIEPYSRVVKPDPVYNLEQKRLNSPEVSIRHVADFSFSSYVQ